MKANKVFTEQDFNEFLQLTFNYLDSEASDYDNDRSYMKMMIIKMAKNTDWE